MVVTIIVSTVFASLACAAVPAVLFVANLRRYRPPEAATQDDAAVAVLIPARNEEANIGACLACVLATQGVRLEVMVLDDESTDRTVEIVREIAAHDGRVQLLTAPPLPTGWNGKQHACWMLAQASRAPVMLFLDADVRLHPDAIARCVGEQRARAMPLLSGFPRQITVGWMEKLLLPLIHFVLLGFLPMRWMQKTTKPAYAAGCGQFLLAERTAYFACEGHAAIRETRHDGLRLPQLFRRHGYRTDIFDLTELAEVRMYDSTGAVWNGLAKNATEGIATPARIAPFTVMLVLGQIFPVFLAAAWLAVCVSVRMVGATFDQPALAAVVSAAIALALAASYLPRLLAVRRFRQPLASALLHPLGVTLLLLVQWYALTRQISGRPVAWRARSYSSESGEEIG